MSTQASGEQRRNRKRAMHNCENELLRVYPRQAQAEHGEQWTCSCGLTWIHDCDEAEGCQWFLFLTDSERRRGKQRKVER